MNHELAKQLKNAGFPFVKIIEGNGISRNAPLCDDVYGNPYNFIDFNPGHFYVPTLEELIEACPKPLQIIYAANGYVSVLYLGGEGRM